MKSLKTTVKRLLPEHIAAKIGTSIQKFKGEVTIPFLVLVVGNACSLRCKKCGNFCPITKPENRRYDLLAMERDLGNVLSCANHIGLLQIQGGEPFLHSDLGALLDYCAKEEKIWAIEIATNGTIMPSDALLEKIRRLGVKIRISNYPVSREKGQALHARCQELGIASSIYHFAHGKDEWADLGGVDTPKEENDAVVRERYFSCAFKGCLTLENGELNRCSRIHVAHTLQGFMRRDDDHVDVTRKRGLKKRIRHYLEHVDFPEACRYCWGNTKDNLRRCPPAEQMASLVKQGA